MKEVLDYLKDHQIAYEAIKHEPVHTIEEMKSLGILDKGLVCKNLFLRNANGKKHYLVCCRHEKEINLVDLAKQIDSTRLSFASPERLEKYLHLQSGSVSPFGILNDETKSVIVVFDKKLIGEQRVGFHPNNNEMTIFLPFSAVEKMIEDHQNPILYID